MNVLQFLSFQLKFWTTVDDYIRLATMTLLMVALSFWLHISGVWFTLLVTIGVAIDVHDIVSNALEGKPII